MTIIPSVCLVLSCLQSLSILTDPRGKRTSSIIPPYYRKQVKALDRYNDLPKVTWLISGGIKPRTSSSKCKFKIYSTNVCVLFHISHLKLDQQLNTLSYINTNQMKSFLANLNGMRVLTDTLLIIYLYKAMIYCSGVNCPIPWEGWVGK